MKTLEDRMKGVCLDCQAEFAWARFMQGNKLCVMCADARSEEEAQFASYEFPPIRRSEAWT